MYIYIYTSVCVCIFIYMFPPSNLKPSGFRPRVFHGSGYDTHTKHLTNQTIAQKSVLRACKTMHWHQS